MAKGHQGRLGRDLSLMSPEATSAREAGLKQRTSVRTRVVMKHTGSARRGLTRRFIFFPPKLPLSPGKAAEEQHTYTLNLISRQGIWRGGGEQNSALLAGVPPRPRRAVSNVTLWFSQRR